MSFFLLILIRFFHFNIFKKSFNEELKGNYYNKIEMIRKIIDLVKINFIVESFKVKIGYLNKKIINI